MLKRRTPTQAVTIHLPHPRLVEDHPLYLADTNPRPLNPYLHPIHACPCFLRFLLSCIQDVSRVVVNQMLLQAYTLLPTEPPAAALP